MHAALRWWSTAAQLRCSDKYGAIVDRLDWLQPSVGSHHHLSSPVMALTSFHTHEAYSYSINSVLLI